MPFGDETLAANPARVLPARPMPDGARRWRIAGLACAALAMMAALLIHGPIAQFADYHAFADARPLAGLPNAANVLSNLGFAAAALFGLWRLRASTADDRAAWRGFALAVLATAVGSTAYHLAPSDAALVVDRLPIAWACALLLCTFLGERPDARWRQPAALLGAAAIATASVLLWWAGQRAGGTGDLRAYLLLQLGPMLLIPLALLMRLRGVDGPALADAAWWGALGLYALAKLAELRDTPILATFGALSGHTLKHLLAAAAAGLLLLAATRRPQVSPARQLR